MLETDQFPAPGRLYADMGTPVSLHSFQNKFKAAHTLGGSRLSRILASCELTGFWQGPPVHGYASITPHNTAALNEFPLFKTGLNVQWFFL